MSRTLIDEDTQRKIALVARRIAHGQKRTRANRIKSALLGSYMRGVEEGRRQMTKQLEDLENAILKFTDKQPHVRDLLIEFAEGGPPHRVQAQLPRQP